MTKRMYVKNAGSILEENKALLGTMPDGEVAEQLSISTSSVALFRRKSGIDSFSRREGKSKSSQNGITETTRSPQEVPSVQHDGNRKTPEKRLPPEPGASVFVVTDFHDKKHYFFAKNLEEAATKAGYMEPTSITELGPIEF